MLKRLIATWLVAKEVISWAVYVEQGSNKPGHFNHYVSWITESSVFQLTKYMLIPCSVSTSIYWQYTRLQEAHKSVLGKVLFWFSVVLAFYLFLLTQCWTSSTSTRASLTKSDCADCIHKQWYWHKLTAIVVYSNHPSMSADTRHARAVCYWTRPLCRGFSKTPHTGRQMLHV